MGKHYIVLAVVFAVLRVYAADQPPAKLPTHIAGEEVDKKLLGELAPLKSDERVELLAALAASDGSAEAKESALLLLSQIPSDRSIGILLLNLDFTCLTKPAKDEERANYSPAEVALNQIGEPAVGPILHFLDGEHPDSLKRRAVSVLMEIKGEDAYEKILPDMLKAATPRQKDALLRFSLTY